MTLELFRANPILIYLILMSSLGGLTPIGLLILVFIHFANSLSDEENICASAR